ncbi:hypothetical protein N864_02840 [Intrasporangium chromatireducens Q5-1]|uniref:Uncharacterized protein n=1 Tax=Intrasporangium chromatireducens Q5-1 TaxID=584657 RepID=W9GHK9_9MICO|nr:hypothetical protein [Intrasporangium chromatireducens]EWT05716.1 hypothetical protein N864_02840 [Intrasporangium chromatireducens Q5-1]
MADVVTLHRNSARHGEESLFADHELIRDLVPGGADLLHDSRFGDDVWNLAGHSSWKSKAGRQTDLDLSQVDVRWRDAVKHLCVLQMAPHLAKDRAPDGPMADTWASGQEPVQPVTAQGNLKMLSHALRAIDRARIIEFDEAAWERIQQLLVTPHDAKEKAAGTVLSPATGRGRAQQLIGLWQVCLMLDRDDLLGGIQPFDGRETSTLYRGRTKAKTNAVRPSDAVGKYLGFTGWVADHVTADVVRHVDWWAANSRQDEPLSEDELRADLFDLLVDIAERNNGRVPGTRNKKGVLTLAHGALGRFLGQHDADEAFLAGRWAMSQLRGHVEPSEDVTPCPLPITTIDTPDGPVPWARRLLPQFDELDWWHRAIVYTTMYYLSATLMLRDQQLAVLAVDPITVETVERPDGAPHVRNVLHAHRTKNRHSPVPTTVIANARIVRLLRLMRELQQSLGYEPALSEVGLPMLFDQRLAVPLGKDPRVNARTSLHLDAGFANVLRGAAARLVDRGVIQRDLGDLKVSMREVRITCAQAWASREHGAALAAAYGQWDTRKVAMGYVSDVYKQLITPVDPDDAADLVNETKGRALIAAARSRDSLTGRGLPRLDEAIHRADIPLANPTPLTPARLRTLGKRNKNVQQGTFTLCMWQREGARCEGLAGPDFRKCAPGECRNSVMSRGDRARYELRRRADLASDSAPGRRNAGRMDAMNPDIKTEFADSSEEDLQAILKADYDAWVAGTVETGGPK